MIANRVEINRNEPCRGRDAEASFVLACLCPTPCPPRRPHFWLARRDTHPFDRLGAKRGRCPRDLNSISQPP